MTVAKSPTSKSATATTLAASQTGAGDEGLREIETWGQWFRAAHRQRLEALPLDEASRRRELDEIERQADAITARMRSDHLTRSATP